ncbi:hypothetical protein SEA_AIKOY__95 [Mycobacterium phage Aikoy]|uniref:Uncharacterized protein n=1 Tax=Mycobacterium phage Onyinye TaxID=2686235 RepID=A0A6B9LD45_9CAUD|nr:hypothetical protein PP339_gp094 [Mycobacterium phage Onyinye]QHB37498.1 hypothetical protein SEA_ONYINYE_94 [Mycobacterium phage Onyinye]WKW85257.1 hypothetical protein SEA_AIKOY__95 [Mycobacterium phage Aikoy]
MADPKAAAKQRHPAGSKYVPVEKILGRLLTVMSENYWLYGAPSAEAPNRVERWDLRSMLDYAVLTYETGHFNPSYSTFYLQRNTVMAKIMQAAEMSNYGEWRFWETEAERTATDIESVVRHALAAERRAKNS